MAQQAGFQTCRVIITIYAKRASLRACEAREKKPCLSVSPQSRSSVFSLVPDLLFDCLRVLEYAKMRTVLQSIVVDFYFTKLEPV